jgi:hypothetical protein
MYAHLPRRGTHPRTAARRAGARLRRLAGVLAAVTCGLLASAAIVPAAFAKLPPGVEVVRTAHPAQIPATTVRVITAGGMAGWQITLIALGAALVAAATAVLFDRAVAARRAASATTA